MKVPDGWRLFVSGSAREKLKTLAGYFPNVQWRIADGVLQFGTIGNAGKPLSPIIELAGSLMAEARPRRGKNGWLADKEYAAIAGETG